MLRTAMAMLRVMRSRLVMRTAVAGATLLVGCGGGGNRTTASPTASKTQAAPASARVALSVAGGPPREKGKFGSAARVEAGDAVRLLVQVRGAGAVSAPVRISIPKAASRRLAVTASIGEKEERVTIRSAGGKDVSLEAIRYSCTLPPKTVCPAEQVRETDNAYELTFSIAEAGPPLGLAAIVA